MNSERSTRPTSRRAAANSFWRGDAASLRRIWLGCMVPGAIVAATRRMSAQFLSIRSVFNLTADQWAQVLRDARAFEHVQPFRRQIPDAWGRTRNQGSSTQRRHDPCPPVSPSVRGRAVPSRSSGARRGCRGFVDGGGDDLRGERGEAVGDVRVRLDVGFGPVARVEVEGFAAAGGREELAVARGGPAAGWRRRNCCPARIASARRTASRQRRPFRRADAEVRAEARAEPARRCGLRSGVRRSTSASAHSCSIVVVAGRIVRVRRQASPNLRTKSSFNRASGASSRTRAPSSRAARPEKERNPYSRRRSARCSCRVSDRTA